MDEFRDMVKALHRAGIEVILDVVFNHTTEGHEDGPTLCYRGFENRAYYILEAATGRYANYSGCGNTLNSGNSIVRRMIIDSLHHWVKEMHVDGFRFDLAAILSRDEDRPTPGQSPGPLGYRFRPGPGRNQADCRSLGCGRALPGGQLCRGKLEGMERQIPG